MLCQAVNELLSMLPQEVHTFEGSQYPLPVKAAILGDQPLDLGSLRQTLLGRRDGDVKDALEPLLLAAEQVEAAQPDRDRFFMSDHAVQGYVFSGSKWRAGWALVLGGADQAALIARLQEESYMVFTDQPDVADTLYIGPRPTAPIYFLQLMVRYGLIWGHIAPGDDHELGHFLERDMPGLVIVYDDLPPLKYLLALGLMKLGAPAVVPSSYPFPYGNRVVADSIPEILARGASFPNLRQRYYKDEVIRLPDYADPAYARETFDAARALGGTPESFFCLWRTESAGPRLTVTGEPSGAMGVQIDVAFDALSPDLEAQVETTALKAVNYLPGVRAGREEGRFLLELAQGVTVDSAEIGGVIYWGIRAQYPRLERISVHLIYDAEVLAERAPMIRAHQAQRQQTIADMTEANTDLFCTCLECRPFSLVHTCLVTPERMPMCGSRSYTSIKAAALLGSTTVPWQRQRERALPLRQAIPKGQVLDAERGEYAGCNQAIRALTQGRLSRVYLHSLRGHPHTSCGCFNALAFWIPQVDGIGIMLRNSSAVAPTGENWDMLANRAGGKQSAGITGVSLAYIRSPQFLRGDGGLDNVVWVDHALYEKLADRFPPDQRVATEQDVDTIDELARFLDRRPTQETPADLSS